MTLQSFEGTWEEIQSHVDDFVGHRVRVIVMDEVDSPAHREEAPLSNALSLLEQARRRHQGQRFSDSTDLIREDRQR